MTPKVISKSTLIITLLGLIYLIFPNNNSSLDAYGYGYCIKYGVELISPHHLLYNGFIYYIYTFLNAIHINIDALSVAKIINSIFAVGTLIALNLILKTLDKSNNQRYILLLFVGSCYSFWRYCTENECYIIPIFFSLLSSFYFLKHTLEQKNIFILISGFMGALACLFHQIHFFWWLAIFTTIISLKNKKSSIIYFTPALMVPVIYAIVFITTQKNFNIQGYIKFVFDVYFRDGIVTEGSISQYLFLTATSFFRTFLQIHGYMAFLFKESLLFVIPALVSISLFIFALKTFIKTKCIKHCKHKSFINSHIAVFILQFSFAAFSFGNGEFMIMLPTLIAIVFYGYFNMNYKPILWLSLGIFIWNLSYGAIAYNKLDFTKNENITTTIMKNPKAIFIVKDACWLKNQIVYNSGINFDSIKVYDFNKPETIKRINNAIEHKISVYTNIDNRIKVFNRAYVIGQNFNKIFLNSYNFTKTDSTKNFYGLEYTYSISYKK